MRIDQPNDGEATRASLDAPAARPAGPGGPETPAEPGAAAPRAERNKEIRLRLDAAFRAYAIDLGCAQVERIERETVTPAMRQIEAEDPGRHLAGLEHRLKERYRIEEKVTEAIEERGHTISEAFGSVKDAIRYTLCYPEQEYSEGVRSDCERLKAADFAPFDRRNSWEHEEYKGINSRWQVPASGELFEVQFHTEASLTAKEETHDAYKRLRSLPKDEAEVGHLRAYQREVTAKVPIPPGALDIPDY